MLAGGSRPRELLAVLGLNLTEIVLGTGAVEAYSTQMAIVPIPGRSPSTARLPTLTFQCVRVLRWRF